MLFIVIYYLFLYYIYYRIIMEKIFLIEDIKIFMEDGYLFLKIFLEDDILYYLC